MNLIPTVEIQDRLTAWEVIERWIEEIGAKDIRRIAAPLAEALLNKDLPGWALWAYSREWVPIQLAHFPEAANIYERLHLKDKTVVEIRRDCPAFLMTGMFRALIETMRGAQPEPDEWKMIFLRREEFLSWCEKRGYTCPHFWSPAGVQLLSDEGSAHADDTSFQDVPKTLHDVLSLVVDSIANDPKASQALARLLPFGGTPVQRRQPTTEGREKRKKATQAMYQDWRNAYQELKRLHPKLRDQQLAQKIAKLDIANNREAETIRSQMKGPKKLRKKISPNSHNSSA